MRPITVASWVITPFPVPDNASVFFPLLGVVELVVVKDPLAALAAWWLFPYSSVAAVGGKSELASMDPAELPPDSLVRIFCDEDHIAGSAAGRAERRLEPAGFEVQLGSLEWEFGTDLQGLLSQQIAE